MKQYGKIIKNWFTIMILLIIGIFSISIPAAATGQYDFVNFTEEDSMAFVEECGIVIPENLLNSEDLISFTHDIVLSSFENPDVPFCFNYYKTQQYAEAIRTAVQSYKEANKARAISLF